MVLAAATKALKQANALKDKALNETDLLTDNAPWVVQQQLIGAYRKVLLLDLEFALDKKVEQDLWMHGIRHYIANLQAITKDKKHPKRVEAQAMLHWCLESSAGFYLSLVQEVCSTFDLEIPFRKNGTIYGCSPVDTTKRPQPSKQSTYYISQHCLVHLGDIARYRNQNRQAETFYKYALILSPTSGQPYNQLAILEASRGDKVSAVFHYVRAVALPHPFPAAATNLKGALCKHVEDVVKIEGQVKLSSHEYLSAFLKFHGILYSHTDLDKAEKLVQTLITSLTAHIATESLSSWKLIQMVAINIFALQTIDQDDKDVSEVNNEIANLVTHLLAGSLNAFLLPVYTIKEQEPLLDFFAMPAIKLTLELIRIRPSLLQSTAFTVRRQIWPSLCRFLNQMQTFLHDFQASQYSYVPLPEDRDLQGFLPLEDATKELVFHTDDHKTDTELLNKLRAARLVEFGKWLAEQTPPLITMSTTSDDAIEFETVDQPELPKELLKELEELSLGKVLSCVQSDSSGSGTGASTPDSNSYLPHAVALALCAESIPEKKGILKNEYVPDKSVDVKTSVPRGIRNVALNSILNQKMSEDVKQVTFKTPSPVKEKEKPIKVLTAIKKPTVIPNKPKTSPKSESGTVEMLKKPKEESDQKKRISSDGLNTEQKQQMLSALLNESSVEQPHATSGLLNLNRQQQEILISSKQAPIVQPVPRPQTSAVRPTAVQSQQRVVEKMEAARKEYEDAMLQQRKLELTEQQPRYHGESEQFRYNRMIQPPPQLPPPQPIPAMYVPFNQPFMGMQMPPMQPYPCNMPRWQEPVDQPPPMPPASWRAAERPPHLVQGVNPAGYWPQPQLNTYSLFSNPMGPEPNPNLQMPDRIVNQQQSFWSGPGPSPLERLLEQQRKQVQKNDPNA